MAIKRKDNELADAAVLERLGSQVARARLGRNLTQAALAREAGVSKRTLVRLEAGESTQVTNLVRVLRALGLLGRLEEIFSPDGPSPLELLRGRGRVRRRATGRRGGGGDEPGGAGDAWTWGDDDASGAS